jgi:hypothetical protein
MKMGMRKVNVRIQDMGIARKYLVIPKTTSSLVVVDEPLDLMVVKNII